MPNWKTHLEVAKRLNNKLELKGNEYIEFLFGNILPDINNAFIVTDISYKISHNITHFNKDTYKGYSDFYNKYKDYMNNKVVLGYYTHLYTDYIFNNDFYSKEVHTSDNKEKLRILKQNDFKLFNNNFSNNNINTKNIDNLVEKSKVIKEININKEDVIKVIEYLNKKDKVLFSYNYYSDEYLNKLLDSTVKIIGDML